MRREGTPLSDEHDDAVPRMEFCGAAGASRYMERVWAAYYPHYETISRRVHELNEAMRARAG